MLCSLFTLIGCATVYQKMGPTGGYSDTRLQEDMFQVSFSANAFTGHEKARTYMLYRCAELTLENGFDYFIVLSEQEKTKKDVVGFYGTGTGSVQQGQFPSYTAQIKCGKGPKPADNQDAFDAKDLIKYMESKIQR